MHEYPETFQISQTQQFRSILRQISTDNELSLRECLLPLLEGSDQFVKKTANICLEELTKKEQQLNNVVEFSLRLLDELELNHQSLSRTGDRLAILSRDFDQLLAHNEQLTKKIEQIQDENYQFKHTILQAQTYITENSLPNSYETEPEPKVHTIEISTFAKKFSHLTERPSLNNQNSISIEQLNSKIQLYQQKLQFKDFSIDELKREVKGLNNKIARLETELAAKHSELELSELYFKEKLDIVAQKQSFNKSQQVIISQIQLHSVFKRDLLRVNSSKSIMSLAESSKSSESDHSQQSQNFCTEQTTHKRTNHVRRSLMYDFTTDFGIEAHHNSLYSSIIEGESISPDISLLRESKKSISVSTADIKKTLSKGVQTCFEPVTRIGKRPSNRDYLKAKDIKASEESSFLGLGSITSIFSKKSIEKEKSIIEAVELQIPAKSEYSILGESSLGDIFRGILNYATKKIVTDRVHKKGKGNLNQSFTEELKRSLTKNKSYFKGMKN